MHQEELVVEELDGFEAEEAGAAAGAEAGAGADESGFEAGAFVSADFASEEEDSPLGSLLLVA
jgi:hypothetical protein